MDAGKAERRMKMETIRNLATRMLKWWCNGMLFIDSVENNLDEDEFREILDVSFDAKEYVDAVSMKNVIKGTAGMIFFAPVMWFAKVLCVWKYKHQKSEEEA